MTDTDDDAAVLVLEDGRTFTGKAFGARGATTGEAVFCTGMTGYQETLTDPSYHRQIVVATAPQIGNTGWNSEDSESRSRATTSDPESRSRATTSDPESRSRATTSDPESRSRAKTQGSGAPIWVAGYAVREVSRRAAGWRSTGTLADELSAQAIVGIAGIDTRAAVRHLRERGSMRAGIFSGAELADPDTMLRRVRDQAGMLGSDLAEEVSTSDPYVVEPDGPTRFTVAALDLGIKTNTPRMLAARGVRVHVLPATTSPEELLGLRPDGFFLSNGPGDPATADGPVSLTRAVLDAGVPTFGICFGNQLLARALGRGTYKMRYGHRGMNVPVLDHATGRVSITAQNHGFAVEGEAGERFDTPFGRAVVTHTCANDGTVEGVALESGSAFSVQYHPEAAAGPHDAAYLFDRFVDRMAGGH